MNITKQSLAQQVKEELLDRIINLEIEQGAKINVSELEEEFGISRAPVREALQSLADQGFVEVKPRVGYFAVDLSERHIQDICEMRKLLETFALGKSFGKMPEVKLEKIKTNSLKLKEDGLPHEEERKIFDKTDENLHGMIIERADNELLETFAGRIHNLIGLTRHLNERIHEAVDEHLELIDAILDGDRIRAEKSLCSHLNRVQDEVLTNRSN